VTALDGLPSDGQAGADELLIRELQGELDRARAARDRWQEASLDLLQKFRLGIGLGVALVILTFGALVGAYFNGQTVSDLTTVERYQQRIGDANACRQAVAQAHQSALGTFAVTEAGTPEHAEAVGLVQDAQRTLDKVISGQICPVPNP